MFDMLPNCRWKPLERDAWMRRAYGRNVMFETKGGTLTATLDRDHSGGFIYLQSQISGRMLVEVYCNEVQVLDELVSNEDLDCFVELPRTSGLDPYEIEVHFIPATFGEARIARNISFVTKTHMTAPVKKRALFPTCRRVAV